MPLEQFLIEPMLCRDCEHSINLHEAGKCRWMNEIVSLNSTIISEVTTKTCKCQLRPMDIVRYHIHREIEERSKS